MSDPFLGDRYFVNRSVCGCENHIEKEISYLGKCRVCLWGFVLCMHLKGFDYFLVSECVWRKC